MWDSSPFTANRGMSIHTFATVSHVTRRKEYVEVASAVSSAVSGQIVTYASVLQSDFRLMHSGPQTCWTRVNRLHITAGESTRQGEPVCKHCRSKDAADVQVVDKMTPCDARAVRCPRWLVFLCIFCCSGSDAETLRFAATKRPPRVAFVCLSRSFHVAPSGQRVCGFLPAWMSRAIEFRSIIRNYFFRSVHSPRGPI